MKWKGRCSEEPSYICALLKAIAPHGAETLDKRRATALGSPHGCCLCAILHSILRPSAWIQGWRNLGRVQNGRDFNWWSRQSGGRIRGLSLIPCWIWQNWRCVCGLSLTPSRNWKRKKPFIYEMISRAPLGSQILGRSLLRYSKGGPLRINSIPLEGLLPTFFVLHELFFRADGHDLISPSLRWKVVEFSLNVAHSSITKKGAPLDGVPNI